MNEKSEQEQIIDEAKKLNPDAPDALVTGLSTFLGSDLNKVELSSSSLKQLTESLLGKSTDPVKTNEN